MASRPSDIDNLLKAQFSCRYYTPQSVPRETMEGIIDVARNTPSGGNIQPWKVYIVTGDALRDLSKDITKAFLNGAPGQYESEYEFLPSDPPAAIKERQSKWGAGYYGTLNVSHDDVAGNRAAILRNFQFYGAPVALVFTTERKLPHNSWLNIGYFAQSVTLAARSRGLESVSQQSIAIYHKILRRHIPITEEEIVIMGMSMGYPDHEEVAKWRYRPERREVSDVASFIGF
ncbi:Nitroreductase [Cylindrobasidium torrendii FP15055 ss-10]|uniref:Nitroreductase n=1 Tax=Cylindrobasidium torrendii FP15055 ss-10 TaxID=1314674 RepID=A0A0D7B125_9AGAR|nr:Nitroreductase [Cylindrobasidium torrendii FP15055 ss-10]